MLFIYYEARKILQSIQCLSAASDDSPAVRTFQLDIYVSFVCLCLHREVKAHFFYDVL